jgi:hypothetical protein
MSHLAARNLREKKIRLAKANQVSFDIFCLARQSLPRQI